LDGQSRPLAGHPERHHGEQKGRALAAQCPSALESSGRDRRCRSVSTRQFRHQSFRPRITDALRDGGVDPDLVSLALGEATLLQDTSTSRRLLDKPHALGVRMALDDFGLGSSCLGEITDLPLDALEINRSLVEGLDDGARAPA
jgi:EAL domain-containing protein (putative c-di-GMP-specific phosphodiesterase class I)